MDFCPNRRDIKKKKKTAWWLMTHFCTSTSSILPKITFRHKLQMSEKPKTFLSLREKDRVVVPRLFILGPLAVFCLSVVSFFCFVMLMCSCLKIISLKLSAGFQKGEGGTYWWNTCWIKVTVTLVEPLWTFHHRRTCWW